MNPNRRAPIAQIIDHFGHGYPAELAPQPNAATGLEPFGKYELFEHELPDGKKQTWLRYQEPGKKTWHVLGAVPDLRTRPAPALAMH